MGPWGWGLQPLLQGVPDVVPGKVAALPAHRAVGSTGMGALTLCSLLWKPVLLVMASLIGTVPHPPS